MRLLLFFFLLPSLSNAQNFGGNPAAIRWKQINTKDLRIIFPEEADSQAQRIYAVSMLADSAGKYRLGKAKGKWNLVLQNKTSLSNAYVRMAPRMSEFYMIPEQDNFSTGSLRWEDNLAIHEERHIHQFRNFNKGITRVFSFLLGQEGQLLANGITIPDYFFEGDAVWQETAMTAQGRGRMPSFYNGMKSLWQADKKYNWMKLRSGSLKDDVPNHYELGYLLVAYGYEKYGADFWQKVTDDAVRFKGVFYPFNQAIAKHSGVSYPIFREAALQYFIAKMDVSPITEIPPDYITAVQKNNVVNYSFPAIVSGDTIVFSKSSYKNISAFYFLHNGKEEKIKVKNLAPDEYFSYRNGLIAYAAYHSDPYRANRTYNEIRLLNIYTKKQVRLTHKTRYFSPDISPTGKELIVVDVAENGSSCLRRIDILTGESIGSIPNAENYFYTQTKYIDAENVVSAVRRADGKMALLQASLVSGKTKILSPWSENALGYPSVKNDTVYYSMMQHSNGIYADMIFAVSLSSGNIFQLTQNENGIYGAVPQDDGSLVASRFTAEGYRLQRIAAKNLLWIKAGKENGEVPFPDTTQAGLLQRVNTYPAASVTKYKKGLHLFNFHSARPSLSSEEYGYEFYSDNVLSSLNSSLRYLYNRNDHSSSIELNTTYAGAFPFLTAGAAYAFNRRIDTSLTGGIHFNSAKLQAGFYVPLRFTGGRSFKNINAGITYNLEQIPYLGIGKNVLENAAFKYINAYVLLANQSQRAMQHIHPRWAQSFLLRYRKSFNYFKTGKFLGSANLYLPGISINHSLVITAALQQKDTLPDLFGSNFPSARGYEDLDTRRMYKIGATYHFPLLYPDLGAGNIAFVQRIRGAVFFDYGIARARYRGVLTDLKNRSTGGEIYFDGKIWNALEASIGIRYSRLLDTDLRNPAARNVFEIVLPINLIPD